MSKSKRLRNVCSCQVACMQRSDLGPQHCFLSLESLERLAKQNLRMRQKHILYSFLRVCGYGLGSHTSADGRNCGYGQFAGKHYLRVHSHDIEGVEQPRPQAQKQLKCSFKFTS
jgi:hypothetical protein